MTAAPNHSTISLEARQNHTEVSTASVVLRRSERLVNKPKLDYRQVALQPKWPISTAVSSNPGHVQTLSPSSSFAALQQHANPSAFETVSATLVERGRNVTQSVLRTTGEQQPYLPESGLCSDLSILNIYSKLFLSKFAYSL